jgi:inorganic pyrophosphatase
LWSKVSDISELPIAIVDRLMHYFLTYKYEPDKLNNVSIGQPYGYEHAATVIRAAMDDYQDAYGAELS